MNQRWKVVVVVSFGGVAMYVNLVFLLISSSSSIVADLELQEKNCASMNFRKLFGAVGFKEFAISFASLLSFFILFGCSDGSFCGVSIVLDDFLM